MSGKMHAYDFLGNEGNIRQECVVKGMKINFTTYMLTL
jgi:hypothetical protein